MSQQTNSQALQPALSASSATAICELVEQDLATGLALLHLLEQEQNALQARDHELLRELLEEKTSLLNTLDAGSSQRAEFLTELQQPTSKEAWQNLIDNIGNAELKERWQSLQDTIDECQLCNEVNGKIIGRSQQSMQTLISILRGKPQGSELYGADGGRSSGQYNSGALVQA